MSLRMHSLRRSRSLALLAGILPVLLLLTSCATITKGTKSAFLVVDNRTDTGRVTLLTPADSESVRIERLGEREVRAWLSPGEEWQYRILRSDDTLSFDLGTYPHWLWVVMGGLYGDWITGAWCEFDPSSIEFRDGDRRRYAISEEIFFVPDSDVYTLEVRKSGSTQGPLHDTIAFDTTIVYSSNPPRPPAIRPYVGAGWSMHIHSFVPESDRDLALRMFDKSGLHAQVGLALYDDAEFYLSLVDLGILTQEENRDQDWAFEAGGRLLLNRRLFLTGSVLSSTLNPYFEPRHHLYGRFGLGMTLYRLRIAAGLALPFGAVESTLPSDPASWGTHVSCVWVVGLGL